MKAESKTRSQFTVSFDGETDGHVFETADEARQYLDDVAYHIDHGGYHAEDYPTPWRLQRRFVQIITSEWEPYENVALRGDR